MSGLSAEDRPALRIRRNDREVTLASEESGESLLSVREVRYERGRKDPRFSW